MKRQRGEGKVGCLVSLLLLSALGAAAFKAVPVYYGNSELVDACEFIASGASRKPVEVLEREVKEKARSLGVAEVLADKSALRITKSGNGEVGHLHHHPALCAGHRLLRDLPVSPDDREADHQAHLRKHQLTSWWSRL